MDAEFYNWLKDTHRELTVILTSIENGEDPSEDILLNLFKQFEFCQKEL